jgi:hypothetical protein
MWTKMVAMHLSQPWHRAEILCEKGHVNNVIYNRYAESGRVNWTQKLAALDPENAKAWRGMLGPTGDGLILRAITTEYKFVSCLEFYAMEGAVD